MPKPSQLHVGRAELSSGGVPLTWSRRQVLVAGLGAVLWPTLAKWSHGSVLNRNHRLGPNPFGLGVASGDPTPEGAVLWTRIAPDPLSGEELEPVAMPVKWEVADDEKFSRIVQSGRAVATPDLAHSVHVELKGLPPDRWYFYRFITSGETSRVGRFRTTPLATAMPRELNFAFASCQHFEQGLFTAYDHLVKEDLDLVFHLGDYIYEYKGKDKLVRKHLGEEIETLANYRQRHAQYKSDEFLQAAHALCPWVVTWDDHEFDNNCANYISEQKNVDAASFLDRRANSYRAYYEHMPLPATCLPEGPHMALYRPSGFGRLADFSVLDTRQYRSDQPCGDGNKPPCPESLSPSQTMLGPKQEQWLADRLKGTQSVWNVLAQQVMMGHVDRKAGEEIAYSMDQWPGYEVERQRVIGFFEREKISNPVVLTGDIHSNWVNNLASGKDDNAAPVATEFVVTSISSGGNGSQNLKYAQTVQDENPFVKFYNAERGYVSCKVTPQSWTSKYQVVEYVDKPGAPLVTRATFEVQAGKAGAERV